jgi:hypothetical protein
LPASRSKKNFPEIFSDFQEKIVEIKFSGFVRNFLETQIFPLLGPSPGLKFPLNKKMS